MAVLKVILAFVLLGVLENFGNASSISKNGYLINQRGNLILGSIGPADILLYEINVFKPAEAGLAVSEDIVYSGLAKIKHIAVMEQGLSQDGTAELMSGGINQTNTTIRMTSAKGFALEYNVSVYGTYLEDKTK